MEDKYDIILDTALINLYTVSKRLKLIRLKEFDRKNKAHLCLYEIAKVITTLHGFPIEIDCGWLDFLLLKRKSQLTTRTKLVHFLDKSCNELIADIEEAYEAPGVFEKIYDSYFGEKRK